jgi:hypothetical protein
MCGERFSVAVSPMRQSRPARTGSPVAPFVAAGVFVLVCLGSYAYTKHGIPEIPDNRSAMNIFDRLTKRPHEMPVLNQAITINQLGYSYIEVNVPAKSSSVQLHGSFTASGGNDNVIEAYVFSEDDYTNWTKRRDASPYYSSGRVSMGKIAANLPAGAGSYYLVFNNKFSVLNPATVRVRAAVAYYQ